MMGFIHFMKEGGIFMFPILLIGLFGLGIFLERIWFLSKVKRENRQVWGAIQTDLKKGNFVDLEKKLKSNNSEISKVLTTGLGAVNQNASADLVESSFEEGLLMAIPKLEVRTNYLSALSNLATLAGLLGTVVGMISAFKAVAKADPALKGDLLSAAISEAMNCTAFGLGTAIPLIIAYMFLHNYTQQIVESIEIVSIKVQNQVRALRGQQ